MHSCLYEGVVGHHRRLPVTHRFSYRLFMIYLDLAELPSLVGRGKLISDSKYSSCSFSRDDHLFDKSQSLENEIRQMITEETGEAPRGPIRMLTQLRYFGYYFSPLNLFYVFDPSGERVEFIVTEVNNTPWHERHCYVLWRGNRRQHDARRYAHPKQFHVSPFMGMDLQYEWRLSQPGSRLTVALSNFENTRKLFAATMQLERRELDRRQLRKMSFRYPWMTAQISAGIYVQALKLWWKKCPFYTHPSKIRSSEPRPNESADPQIQYRRPKAMPFRSSR